LTGTSYPAVMAICGMLLCWKLRLSSGSRRINRGHFTNSEQARVVVSRFSTILQILFSTRILNIFDM